MFMSPNLLHQFVQSLASASPMRQGPKPGAPQGPADRAQFDQLNARFGSGPSTDSMYQDYVSGWQPADPNAPQTLAGGRGIIRALMGGQQREVPDAGGPSIGGYGADGHYYDFGMQRPPRRRGAVGTAIGSMFGF